MHLIESFDLSIESEKTCLSGKLFLFADKMQDLPWEQADAAEIWGSSFTDEGDDFCEVRVMQNGTVMGRVKIKGY